MPTIGRLDPRVPPDSVLLHSTVKLALKDDECAATAGIPSICKLPTASATADSIADDAGASSSVTRTTSTDASRTDIPGNGRV